MFFGLSIAEETFVFKCNIACAFRVKVKTNNTNILLDGYNKIS